MTIDEFIEKMWDDVKRLSRSPRQFVPGMDHDDIASEMLLSLLNAYRSYDTAKGIPIEKYWWSVWRRHRANLIRNYEALKRAELVPVEYGELICMFPSVEFSVRNIQCPVDDPLHRECWKLLALGSRATDVRYNLKLSIRMWYDIVSKWKTDEVREMLTT